MTYKNDIVYKQRTKSDSDIDQCHRKSQTPYIVFGFNELYVYDQYYFCHEHSMFGMTDIGNHVIKNNKFTKCKYEGCSKFAHYGYIYDKGFIVMN